MPRSSLRSSLAVALIALACTYVFFYEYRQPFRRVHIPFDLPGYQYPLSGYAFESFKAGRWPQWDPTMYAGMDFSANTQAALYYPGTWLMFLAVWNRDWLPFGALQDLTQLHVWLAFVLFYFWMRGKRLHMMASILGAAVYAFSGYLCLQLQHFGMVAQYAWIPLALRGIDQAVEQQRWRPLWKVAAASALCFMAGYPPFWVVFAVTVGAYALAQPRTWKISPAVAGALVVSLLLCAVQILPAWVSTQFREPEARYGSGFKDPMFYLSYLAPNYYNFSLNAPVLLNPGQEYLYLGAPGIAGLALALFAMRRGFRSEAREFLPALAILGASFIFLSNPFDLVSRVVGRFSLLNDVVRDWCFLAGITLGVAALAAQGLDKFLSRPRSPSPLWILCSALFLMGVWAMLELLRWPADAFPYGPAALIDPAITLLIFSLGLYVFGTQKGELRMWVGVALLISAGVDYKVFGTSKRFNANRDAFPRYESSQYRGMHDIAREEMQANRTYRVLLDDYGPRPADFRSLGLLTPQGFDPFLSKQYREFISQEGNFSTDREFTIDPANTEALRVLGIRYVITSEQGSRFAQLKSDPRFRGVGPADPYYKVFEYLEHHPPYGLDWAGELSMQTGQPEHRVFSVESAAGGPFTLSEQFYPGWTAKIDGQPARIERWSGTFQSVQVPAGRHTVDFEYQTPYLKLGAAISLLTLLTLCIFSWRAAGQRRGARFRGC